MQVTEIILNILFAGNQNTPPERKIIGKLLQRLHYLINNDSLREIKDMLERLPPDRCIKVLNSTIYDRLPLSWALEHKKIEISNYLFNLSSIQDHRERSEGWNRGFHPLMNALKSGSSWMVFEIARNLWDINAFIRGPYTPLFYAIQSTEISYAGLILLLGGNINKPCLNGITPLISSISNKNMCCFMLELNANINHQDDDGNTALHLAAAQKQNETAKILIDKDADVRIRNKKGMTPLMLASVNINQQLALDLWEHAEYSQLERIEALEVLSACLIGYRSPDISFWFLALEMRTPSFPKTLDVPTTEVLDFSREFTMRNELESLQADNLELAFQGILVIERILGRNNFAYLRQLLQTTMIAKEENRLEKFQQLTDYILQYCQEAPADIIAECSYFFEIFFTEIFSNDSLGNIFENGAFHLFKIIARATPEMWLLVKDKYYRTPYVENNCYVVLADTFLYIAENINNMNLAEEYKRQFNEVVIELVRADIRFIFDQSLLHRTLYFTREKPWASVELIRLLLKSGADINSKDYFRRTPLIYALTFGPDNCIREILKLLVEYKCHLDCRDCEGFSALDFPRWTNLAILPRNPRSLECLAAEAILDHRIEYERMLFEGVKVFVELHR